MGIPISSTLRLLLQHRSYSTRLAPRAVPALRLAPRAVPALCLALGLVMYLGAPPALGSWAVSGNPATLAPQNQLNAQSIPDGAGGIIVVWEDYHNGNADIYAQHLDAAGTPLWGAYGIPICVEPLGQEAPLLVSDGKGGAIIAWQDLRNGLYDIYAQRVGVFGNLRWPEGGIAVSIEAGNQIIQSMTTDGHGDALLAWRDFRSGESNVFAQRINEDGFALWSPNGVPVCVATGLQSDVRCESDPLGGLFVVWRDGRNGATSDLYAQALDASGARRWEVNGIPVCTAPGDQFDPSVVTDGRYGIIVAWQDHRVATDSDVWAQRIRYDGTTLWAPNGIRVTAASGGQFNPVAVPDGKAGAIVAWTDSRVSRPDVYAQGIDSSGVLRWLPADGVALCAADSSQFLAVGVSDGLGGAIFGWDDDRSGDQIYAQAISAGGVARWAQDGVLVASGAGQRVLSTASPDGYHGVLFAWQDFRGGATADIYAFRMTGVGTGVETTPSPAATTRLQGARPNPFNPSTILEFELATAAPITLSIYDPQGRLLRILLAGSLPAGRHTARWDGVYRAGRPCASGVYFARLQHPEGSRSVPITLVR